jgi:hypothetical protein
MAGEPNIEYYEGKTFTLSEACDFMRMLDKSVTRVNVRWVNAHTGQPVSIGYIDLPNSDTDAQECDATNDEQRTKS